MKKLVVIAADHYLRQFIQSGAFDEIDDGELYFVGSRGNIIHPSTLEWFEAHPGWLGTVEDPRKATKQHFRKLRRTLLAALRTKSSTIEHKESMLPPRQQRRHRIAALPGLRHWHIWRAFRKGGIHPELDRIVRDLKPDVMLLPTGGYDTFVWEGLNVARTRGIPTVGLIHNWDNLSSKGAFPIKPDHLAVWGEQSVEHAIRIHGFAPEQVTPVGAPSLDPYFRHQPGSTSPPFPFRYAIFAGCYAPFDEGEALRRIDAALTEAGSDLTIVYRPHPHRRRRVRPDGITDGELSHVVIDPQVRDNYLAGFENEYKKGAKRPKPLFPALDYYPALFEHCEFVICPLSTMLVEAAIFEKSVAIVAYDDGLHENNPAVVIKYEHFERVEEIEGFDVVRGIDDLGPAVVRLAADPAPPRSLREQVAWWVHFDDTTYAHRLRLLLERLHGTATPSPTEVVHR